MALAARTFSALTNRLVSASASVVAVAALGTSLYEARLNREQQRASVWPYVTQGNSGLGGGFHRLVRNAGVGPALVRSFRIRVDDKPVRSWGEVVDALGVPATATTRRWTYSSIGRGTVLTPGETLEILTISDSVGALEFFRRVDHMESVICYCSLYGECWSDSSEKDEPRAVDACPAAADSAGEFAR